MGQRISAKLGTAPVCLGGKQTANDWSLHRKLQGEIALIGFPFVGLFATVVFLSNLRRIFKVFPIIALTIYLRRSISVIINSVEFWAQNTFISKISNKKVGFFIFSLFSLDFSEIMDRMFRRVPYNEQRHLRTLRQ